MPRYVTDKVLIFQHLLCFLMDLRMYYIIECRLPPSPNDLALHTILTQKMLELKEGICCVCLAQHLLETSSQKVFEFLDDKFTNNFSAACNKNFFPLVTIISCLTLSHARTHTFALLLHCGAVAMKKKPRFCIICIQLLSFW